MGMKKRNTFGVLLGLALALGLMLGINMTTHADTPPTWTDNKTFTENEQFDNGVIIDTAPPADWAFLAISP